MIPWNQSEAPTNPGHLFPPLPSLFAVLPHSLLLLLPILLRARQLSSLRYTQLQEAMHDPSPSLATDGPHPDVTAIYENPPKINQARKPNSSNVSPNVQKKKRDASPGTTTTKRKAKIILESVAPRTRMSERVVRQDNRCSHPRTAGIHGACDDGLTRAESTRVVPYTNFPMRQMYVYRQ